VFTLDRLYVDVRRLATDAIPSIRGPELSPATLGERIRYSVEYVIARLVPKLRGSEYWDRRAVRREGRRAMEGVLEPYDLIRDMCGRGSEGTYEYKGCC